MFDNNWKLPVDVCIGDNILTPKEFYYEGTNLQKISANKENDIYRAINTGIGKFVSTKTEWANFCRVSKKEYIGLNKYRHLDEV